MIDTAFVKTALAATLALAMGLPANGTPVERVSKKVSGTWRIEGQPEPACGAQDFVNLASITKDGKVVNVDPHIGTGVGEIRRLPGRRYVAGFFGFINDNGVVLSYEVRSRLRLVDVDHLKGVFTTIISDSGGNLVCSYDGTLEGFRLAPMSP